VTAIALASSACRPGTEVRASDRVELVRVPDAGIQPQTVTDRQGTIHLVYLKGKPAACDVFYRRLAGGEWSAPLRVNTAPGSAVAAGTIRGAHLALGRDSRPHVVWAGPSGHPLGGMPLLYSRLSDGGSAFEPQRNLMGRLIELDGGPSVAADARGRVFVAWHAAHRKGAGEAGRRVWIARSVDDGKTFAGEAAVDPEPMGACPCCSVKAFSDARGGLHVLYRIAAGKTDRGMFLLSSPDGERFGSRRLDRWDVDT
jgi:hypothetical protein